MSVELQTLQDRRVSLASYQSLFSVPEDVWTALRGSTQALIQIHDFSRVEVGRIALRQILFLLSEHQARKPANSVFHSVLVAAPHQIEAFSKEIARCQNQIRLIPVFESVDEAAVYAAMLVVQHTQLTA